MQYFCHIHEFTLATNLGGIANSPSPVINGAGSFFSTASLVYWQILRLTTHFKELTLKWSLSSNTSTPSTTGSVTPSIPIVQGNVCSNNTNSTGLPPALCACVGVYICVCICVRVCVYVCMCMQVCVLCDTGSMHVLRVGLYTDKVLKRKAGPNWPWLNHIKLWYKLFCLM